MTRLGSVPFRNRGVLHFSTEHRNKAVYSLDTRSLLNLFYTKIYNTSYNTNLLSDQDGCVSWPRGFSTETPTQTCSVRGRLMCDGRPASGVKVKLYDVDRKIKRLSIGRKKSYNEKVMLNVKSFKQWNVFV
uniref:F5/8 type C domain-containing protein n=1 Tax=Heterorhabditis bacteriophora TaxID=37862 RepID=A0A1I7X2Q6_HETBA